MYASHTHVLQPLAKFRFEFLTTVSHRHASLTSAIGKGVRRGASALKNAERRRVQEGTLAPWEYRDERKVALAEEARGRREQRKEILAYLSRDDSLTNQSNSPSPIARYPSSIDRQTAKNLGIDIEAPQAVPYSAAATEFIYGTFAVLASLKADRRKFYTLYVWAEHVDGSIDADHHAVIKAAKASGVRIRRVGGPWGRLMDKMSGHRPHNGFVLEASQIPKLPALHLEKVEHQDQRIEIFPASISREERAEMRVYFSPQGTCVLPKNETKEARFPLLLFLDRITDTGNMGAIIRTAYFLGIDAIIVPEHGTAPFSAVTVKASAGAVERVPILVIKNEVEFIEASKQRGWTFYAAGANESRSAQGKSNRNMRSDRSLLPFQTLREHPCVLMLGNEGTGLRPNLQRLADHQISISGANRTDNVIDSLNVSVAAALLMDRFLGKLEEERPNMNRVQRIDSKDPKLERDGESTVEANDKVF